jgi:hypothetical protein
MALPEPQELQACSLLLYSKLALVRYKIQACIAASGNEHTSAYVRIRQHTSAYVSIRRLCELLEAALPHSLALSLPPSLPRSLPPSLATSLPPSLPPSLLPSLALSPPDSTLQLYDNNLRALPEGVFFGLVALDILDLSYNKLSTITPGVFSGLTALRY